MVGPLGATSPFSSSWSVSRYSFKNPSFTKPTNKYLRAIHRSMSCPNPLWNSHRTSFLWPQIPVRLLRKPQFFHNPWHASKCQVFSSLRLRHVLPGSVWRVSRVRSLLGRGFVDPQKSKSATLLGLGYKLLCFTDTASSTLIWATTRRYISANVSVEFLINESLNGPTMIPC